MTRVAMILEARNSSRRWTMVTFEANLVRNSASSMAVSPPPTTISSWSRKKKPSHVAQADTPRPVSPSSPGIPSHLAEAPVAMITASAVNSSAPTFRWNGRDPEVDLGDVDLAEPGPESLRLLAKLVHELGSEDPVGEARVVLDIGGDHQLAAGRRTLEDEGLQVGAGRVESGGEPGRAGSDDDKFLVTHCSFRFVFIQR